MFSTISFSLFHGLFVLVKDSWGVLNAPYKTIRRVVEEKPILPIIFFGLSTWVFLTLAVVVKEGLHTGPLFLTFNLGKLFYAAIVTYIVIVVAIYLTGRLVGGKGEISSVFSVWSYSYLPTLIWFFTTTLLYVFLPPPRTISFLGQIFSIFFVFLSLGLLFWKTLIYFLTLRLVFGLTVWQMIRATLILWPAFFFYFLLLNRMGIFKIPLA